jgi:hypothetical protein
VNHSVEAAAMSDISQMEAREPRRQALARMAKFALAQMCAAGITAPDGGRVVIEGGAAPVIEWTKDEIVQAVLDVEFGRPAAGGGLADEPAPGPKA